MKKIFTIVFITILSVSAYSQDDTDETEKKGLTEDVKIALNLGSISGDNIVRDSRSVSVDLEVSIFFDVTNDLKLGFVTGAAHYLPKKEKSGIENSVDYTIPFAGSIRLYTDNDKFFIGGDAGYAIGFEDGGFYYRPKIGIVLSECSGINVSYSNIEDNGTLSTVSIGYEFTF